MQQSLSWKMGRKKNSSNITSTIVYHVHHFWIESEFDKIMLSSAVTKIDSE